MIWVIVCAIQCLGGSCCCLVCLEFCGWIVLETSQWFGCNSSVGSWFYLIPDMCLRGAMEFKDSIQPNFLLFPICFPLRPFVLMGAIMHNGLMLLRSFSWEENNIITPMTPPPPSPQALNMLIRKLKIPKLGVACGIAWNLRSVRVWFSYQLSNLFGNIPRSCTLVLTILWKFMIFIKLVPPLLSIICLWKTIMEILRVYVKNLIFTNPSLM